MSAVLWCSLALPAIAGSVETDNLETYGSLVATQNVSLGTLPGTQVLYYAFQVDGGSTVADLSGSNNNGTVNGATYTSSGKIHGGAYQFDNSGEEIDVNDAASLDLTNNYTIAAWVYCNNTTGMFDIVTKRRGTTYSDSGYPAYYFGYHDSGKWRLHHRSGATAAIRYSNAYSLQANTWIHTAAVVNSSQVVFYANGVQISAPSNIVAATKTDGQFVLGVDEWSDSLRYRTKGQIDECLVYRRVLSSNEIYNLYLFNGTNIPTASAEIESGVLFMKPLGDLSMGIFTNRP